MKLKTILIEILCLTAVLSGCSSLQSRPTASLVEQIPVVTFGQTLPATDEFILHFPAGVSIPVDVLIDGNLIQTPATQQLSVALTKDIYAYKKWVSYDGKQWRERKDVLGIRVNVKTPGPNNPDAGKIHARFDERSS